MEKPSEDKPDGLEITSIGVLYHGPWDKKYWSSTRGKDRYPYPVGYQAVRTHNGSTYKMEIHEGLKGPLFVVNSAYGQSCSGQTPDIAWESFQKKGWCRTKMWHGKRSSPKIDGVEFFGFRNPFVQRLLRELVANVNGMAERSLLSSSFCNGASGTEHDSQCPGSCTYADLLPYLERPQITKKRRRQHKIKKRKPDSGARLKRLQSQDLMYNSDAPNCSRGNDKNQNDKNCTTSALDACNFPRALPVSMGLVTTIEGGNGSFSSQDGLHLESFHFPDTATKDVLLPQKDSRLVPIGNCKSTGIVNNLSTDEEPLVRSQDTEIGKSDSLIPTEGEDREAPVMKDCPAITHVDLCVPDTLDLLQDTSSESAPTSPKESPHSLKDSLVVAEDLVSELNPEEEIGTSNSNPCSEKSDFDSVGHEIAKSMMTVLLPQALPLLKRSRKTKESINQSEISHCGVKFEENNENDHFVDVESTAGLLFTNCCAEREAKMQILNADIDSVVPDLEHVKNVIPDSFENDKCECLVDNQIPSFSDTAEADQTTSNKDFSTSDNLEVHGCIDGQKKYVCHLETSGSKEFYCCDEACVAHNSMPPKIYNHISESALGCSSSSTKIFCGRSSNVCRNYDENSEEKNLASAVDCSPGTVIEPLFSVSTHPQFSNSENISDIDTLKFSQIHNVPNPCTIIQSKRQRCSPKLVPLSSETAYLAREVSSVSLRENLGAMNCEMHNAELVQNQPMNHSKELGFYDSVMQPNPLYSNSYQISTNPSTDLMGKMRSVQILQKEISVKTGKSGTAVLYFTQIPDGVAPSAKKFSGPLSESIICRDFQDGFIPETNASSGNLLASESCQVSSDAIPTKKIPFDAETRHEEQSHSSHTETTLNPLGVYHDMAPVISQNQLVCASKDNDTSGLLDLSVSHVEKSEDYIDEMLVGHQKLEESNSIRMIQKPETSCDKNLSDAKEVQDGSYTKFQGNMELNNELEGMVNLVGCYVHPMPVSSVLLNTKGDDALICVICGQLVDKDRTLFLYKVPLQEPRVGCPSFVGHTSLMFPISKDKFGREIAMEQSCFQFTPDGQCLVFMGDIKAPSCREHKIDCACPACTSDCLGGDALKIVRVELGYVSVMGKLKATDSVRCFLVCEPNYLVAAGESGGLHIFVMNSTWSALAEEFVLPTYECVSPWIVELKRIPKCNPLIVGHNGFGEFGLWDIYKCALVSRFSAPSTSVFNVIPISLFSWQREGPHSGNAGVEDHIQRNMDATKMWFPEQGEKHAFLPPDEEDMAVWLFVSTVADRDARVQHDHQSGDGQKNQIRQWRLALLVKNMVILGSPLDLRAATIGASACHGIIGTHDGLVYMWEISTGAKLGTLHYFKASGGVTCIAVDDSCAQHVMAVAGDGGELLVYLHRQQDFAN
ncbi:uncharacterized protein LOC131153051 isoform X2 [Malania oleifera]|uniref:uncharacterized protein LOC131153051 isoform X2 n=1 Tax=Malania oleifera TaxID=397392 RepID=UPI0025ADA01E|nr:uncharacterized protein LOC131153051 isoform X2 [Malania oleifera]